MRTMAFSEGMSVATQQLEMFQIHLTNQLTEEMMGVEMNVRRDLFSRRVLAEVHGYIWAEKKTLEMDTSWEEPSTVWQMFKRDYAPQWFLRKYPVAHSRVKREYTVSFFKKYPEFKYEVDKRLGQSIPYMMYEKR